MSNKYIGQINNQNFIYPNNDLPEYDIDIIHNINDYSVSGTVTNFVVSGVTTTGITVAFDYTWSLNNAERFLRNNGNTSIFSLHMLAAGQDYFKPWRIVNSLSQGPTITSFSGHSNSIITATQAGLTSFTNGTYYFEIRFIGSNAIYPICQSYTVSTLPTPTPTPTPSPTPTPISPTATPTPTPTVTGFTSGATLNVTDTGYIKYVKKGDSSATYVFISILGTYTITDCLTCSTILPGFPFADIANFTVTSCGSVC
jgi:hypothetical protein